VDWFTRKTNPFGNGVTGKLLHNGVEKDSVTLAGADTVGVSRMLTLSGVNAGDFIELALTPLGVGGDDTDGADGSANGMTIYSCVAAGDCVVTDVASQMKNVNSTAYLRLPFNAPDPACISQLKLRMKYDDGFVAYLNGVEVARRNAPSLQTAGHFADSVADWSGSGTQGANNWFYGYYNQTADMDGIYNATTDFNSTDPNWTFGGAWTLGPGDPPWNTIGQYDWHPNGINNGHNDWVIRRWVSEMDGTATVTLRFAKASTACGNGVTGRLHRNGSSTATPSRSTIPSVSTSSFPSRSSSVTSSTSPSTPLAPTVTRVMAATAAPPTCTSAVILCLRCPGIPAPPRHAPPRRRWLPR
jgi:hypothetical protein